MSLSELARHAQGLAEILLARSQSIAEGRGEKASCGRGCAACCRQMIPLSPPEAFRLCETLSALPQPAGSGVLDRIAALGNSLRREGMEKLSLSNHTQAYFRLGLPCPFLVAESCAIHEQRPLACREHIAVSPATRCSDFPDPFIRMLSLPVSVGDALGQAAADAIGTGVEMIPMARVLEWVEANGELGARTWDAGFLLDRLEAHCPAETENRVVAPG